MLLLMVKLGYKRLEYSFYLKKKSRSRTVWVNRLSWFNHCVLFMLVLNSVCSTNVCACDVTTPLKETRGRCARGWNKPQYKQSYLKYINSHLYSTLRVYKVQRIRNLIIKLPCYLKTSSMGNQQRFCLVICVSS